MERAVAIDHLEAILETVEDGDLPVPVREVWTFGDVALGLDPVERLEVYVTKDLLLRDDDTESEPELRESLGVKGIGRTIRADWARTHPDWVRTNDAGYAAPERCLAAQLLPDGAPAHLEVCNTGFEDNVTQRLEGAMARESYEQILDPRGVCLWIDGERSEDAIEKLRESELAFPPLSGALEMLGMDPGEAEVAADALETYREEQEGATVRGDVV